MARAFLLRNFGVFVLRERGAQHHRPHAHIQIRGRRVASVFLESLEVYDAIEQLPKDLLERIREEQAALLNLWMELNEDD